MDQLIYIKYLLKRKGIKHKDLAEAIGTSRQNITGVLNGGHKSRSVQEHIAKLLGRDYVKLWSKTPNFCK